ncbi:hypothetical protein E2562_017209 [Oryza meyeriana var. granulata]|uniref:Uncharacterized protein n=1 Tax=Oryza meyeriana var. granulata TaxID=110450 RepID=A0A6G1EM63_9ORYZ|nr:hypothetical protein E2562_017209 [Oryza meyeriana var. granulata]
MDATIGDPDVASSVERAFEGQPQPGVWGQVTLRAMAIAILLGIVFCFVTLRPADPHGSRHHARAQHAYQRPQLLLPQMGCHLAVSLWHHRTALHVPGEHLPPHQCQHLHHHRAHQYIATQ